MSWRFEEVLLVRHGETEWNTLGRRQGQLDSPLTATGVQQAKAIASHLARTSDTTDALFSSPLGRARATAGPISLALGHPVQLLADLSEVHHGEFAGLTSAEIEERSPGALKAREQNKFDWRFPGGESYRDAAARSSRALDEINSRLSKRPMIVAHEMIGRMLIGQLLQLSPDEALEQSLPHGTIVHIDPNAGGIRFVSAG